MVTSLNWEPSNQILAQMNRLLLLTWLALPVLTLMSRRGNIFAMLGPMELEFDQELFEEPEPQKLLPVKNKATSEQKRLVNVMPTIEEEDENADLVDESLPDGTTFETFSNGPY
jgi:hypothetical protein